MPNGDEKKEGKDEKKEGKDEKESVPMTRQTSTFTSDPDAPPPPAGLSTKGLSGDHGTHKLSFQRNAHHLLVNIIRRFPRDSDKKPLLDKILSISEEEIESEDVYLRSPARSSSSTAPAPPFFSYEEEKREEYLITAISSSFCKILLHISDGKPITRETNAYDLVQTCMELGFPSLQKILTAMNYLNPILFSHPAIDKEKAFENINNFAKVLQSLELHRSSRIYPEEEMKIEGNKYPFLILSPATFAILIKELGDRHALNQTTYDRLRSMYQKQQPPSGFILNAFPGEIYHAMQSIPKQVNPEEDKQNILRLLNFAQRESRFSFLEAIKGLDKGKTITNIMEETPTTKYTLILEEDLDNENLDHSGLFDEFKKAFREKYSKKTEEEHRRDDEKIDDFLNALRHTLLNLPYLEGSALTSAMNCLLETQLIIVNKPEFEKNFENLKKFIQMIATIAIQIKSGKFPEGNQLPPGVFSDSNIYYPPLLSVGAFGILIILLENKKALTQKTFDLLNRIYQLSREITFIFPYELVMAIGLETAEEIEKILEFAANTSRESFIKIMNDARLSGQPFTKILDIERKESVPLPPASKLSIGTSLSSNPLSSSSSSSAASLSNTPSPSSNLTNSPSTPSSDAPLSPDNKFFGPSSPKSTSPSSPLPGTTQKGPVSKNK